MMSQMQQLLSRRKDITEIINSDNFVDENVVVCGWVNHIRKQKNIAFCELYDSAETKINVLHVVFRISENPEYFEKLQRVYVGSSILVSGKLVKLTQRKQSMELVCAEYEILGSVADPDEYPLAGRASNTLDVIRQYPELECHSTIKSSIYSVRIALMKASEEFFNSNGYLKVEMPAITFSECEGGCQPFQVTSLLQENDRSKIALNDKTGLIDFDKDFFGMKSFLTVSSQLELETQLPLGDVWTVTRAFRGEHSQTSKHLSEFSMIEIEKRFSISSIDIINITEQYIKFCIQKLLTTHREQLMYIEKFYETDNVSKLEQYASLSFVQISHAEAITILKNVSSDVCQFEHIPDYSEDLSSEHEKYLADVLYKQPVVIKNYPKAIKSFYMPKIHETEIESHGVEHVDCFDIIVPGVGELVGGSQRIHEYDELMERISDLGMSIEPLQYYINLRKYGSVPHGGCGIGFERLVKFIAGVGNVKDCVPFPRYIKCG